MTVSGEKITKDRGEGMLGGIAVCKKAVKEGLFRRWCWSTDL